MGNKIETIEEVNKMISAFASKNFSKEEEAICLHMWEKLGRKQRLDVTRTRSDIWAAAVIWAFCRANFKYEEGVTLELLCSYFNNKKSTVGNKASEILKMLRIDFFSPEFTTKKIQEQNPLDELALTQDGFIVPKDSATSNTEQLAFYRRLRSLQKDLHSELLEMLPRGAIVECGKALGIYKDGILVFNAESETSVLMDYSIYDYRWDGRNVVER